VHDMLRAELMSGAWPFGASFSTYDLAHRFGISRRPVMDALARLESAGFVEIIPQVGCRVVLPREEQVREHFQLAGALEGAAARLAARAPGAAQIARLEAIHLGAEPLVEAGDGAGFADANRELHAAILDLAGNATIARIARETWDLRDFYLHDYLQDRPSADLVQRHAEHRHVLDAIAARDPEGARGCMEAHLERFAREVVIPGWAAAEASRTVAGES